MGKIKSFFSILFLLPLLFISSNSFAEENLKNITLQSAKPSLTLWGFGDEGLIGIGQGLIPLGGISSRDVFFSAMEAAGSPKEGKGYSAGAAIGYRNAINNSVILGEYFFADFNRSPMSHNFAIANPGFEALGNVWDFRANGYIPLTKKHWNEGEEWAEDLGINEFEHAFGHFRSDHLFQNVEEVGPGIDAEVGRKILLFKNHSPKIYVGGYHYFMDKTDNFTGIEGRLVYPVKKHFALELRDSFDQVHKNVFMGGIRFSFGGNNNEEQMGVNIAKRLSDPIEHNFGNFASANSVPVNQEFVDEGIEHQLPGSFWYFDNADLSNGDGTYEHPFNTIDQNTYFTMTHSGIASQNVQMYVATGILPYDFSVFPDHRLTLLNGYSIYGRTDNFLLAANNSERPEFLGGIKALSNNNISDIRLSSQNDDKIAGALFLNDALNVYLNEAKISVSENNIDAYGIKAINSSLTINNSVIEASSVANSLQSFGINLINSSLFLVNNNSINVSLFSTQDNETHAGGIIGGNSLININGDNNQIVATINSDQNARAVGIGEINILPNNADKLTISGNYNYISALASGYDSRAGGIIDVGNASIFGNNNKIISNATGDKSKAIGIGAFDILPPVSVTSIGDQRFIISGNNNQISATSANSNAIGILDIGDLILFGNNNQITAVSVGKDSQGDESNASAIITFGNALIFGSNNQIIATSLQGNAISMSVSEMLSIFGSNNQIIASAPNGSAIGAIFKTLNIFGCNNVIIPNFLFLN